MLKISPENGPRGGDCLRALHGMHSALERGQCSTVCAVPASIGRRVMRRGAAHKRRDFDALITRVFVAHTRAHTHAHTHTWNVRTAVKVMTLLLLLRHSGGTAAARYIVEQKLESETVM